ncbi:MAG: hypothetical protein ACLR23_05625 [Clostridia bacterium]
MNDTWLPSKPTLNQYAVETTIYTREHNSSSSVYAETQDKVTLLTEADVFGTWAGSAAEAKQYTLGKEGIIVPEEMRIAQYDGTADSYWLRSIQNNSVEIPLVQSLPRVLLAILFMMHLSGFVPFCG